MLTFLKKYAKNYKYSQNGEEGIIEECFQRMRIRAPRMVEFGAHNGCYCSNTRYFATVWNGASMMIEADDNLYSVLRGEQNEGNIIAVNDSVYPENINKYTSLFDLDLLSIDTDGDNDYDCFSAMKARSKIVIVEINSSFGPEVTGRKDCYTEMLSLALSKDYFLLCHTGNLIFIDNKYRNLFPEMIENGIFNSELYFNTSWLTQ